MSHSACASATPSARASPSSAASHTPTQPHTQTDTTLDNTRAHTHLQEPFGVTLGACIGHSLCTGIAVVGGKLLASRISERAVLGIGG